MDILTSIIIPVFNREDLIIETLLSIKNQSYKKWECILVDDHSTDNTIPKINSFIKDDKRFKLFKRPNNTNKGANSSRNYGFQKSIGQFINWFDSDDLMHPNFLEKKIEIFISGDCDVTISKTQVFSNTIKNILYKENRTRITKNILNDFLTLKVSWYLPDSMWRRTFLENKELFDEKLFKGQDRDFHTRMLMRNPKIELVDQYLTYYRRHEKSISDTVSISVIKSLFDSLNKRIRLLKNQYLNTEIKIFFLKQQVSNYAYLYKEKGILKKYVIIFKVLFTFNLSYFKILFRFMLAIIFYSLFNKGSKLLKN